MRIYTVSYPPVDIDTQKRTHEVVKHMITLENTFDWYNTERNLRRVYMYVSTA